MIPPTVPRKFEKMAENASFAPKLENLKALQDFQEFCKDNTIVMVIQCLNIPKIAEQGLYRYLQENDVMAEEDLL